MDSLADTVSVSTINVAPVADAGADQAVFVGDNVTLDGSQSNDSDGDFLTYSWSFSSLPSGSTASLNAPTAVNPVFTVDTAGVYTLSLVVNDGSVDSAPSAVSISTINVAPVADAGPNQSGVVGDLIVLDGSQSNDADGDTLTFNWSFMSLPAGSTTSLSDSMVINPDFVADIAGMYVLSLVVNDGGVNSTPSAVNILAVNLESVVITELQELIAIINAIDPGLFKNKNQVKALTNKINTVIASVEAANFADATAKLETDIRRKTDGCALTGTPDKNDWIRDCSAQGIVYSQIQVIVDLLNAL